MSPTARGTRSPETSPGSATSTSGPDSRRNARSGGQYLSERTEARGNCETQGVAPAQGTILIRSPRSIRGAATKERIIEAAAMAFDERGYLGVNLNEVVVNLGLTKGALYHFFPTKEDLAVEIVSRHFSAWGPMADEVFTSYEDKLEALVEITYRVARSYQNNPIARAGSRLSTERNLINAQLPEPFVEWIDRLTRLLRSAKARRQLRTGVQPSAVANMVVAFFFGAQAVSRAFDHDRCDLVVRLDQFWKVVLPSLRPD